MLVKFISKTVLKEEKSPTGGRPCRVFCYDNVIETKLRGII